MVLDRIRLDGRAALVTGGSRGLGLGMALALAEAGADIALVARSADRLRASPASDYITGQILWVDGGWLLMGGGI